MSHNSSQITSYVPRVVVKWPSAVYISLEAEPMGFHGFHDCPVPIADFDCARHPLVVDRDRLVGLPHGRRRALVRDYVVIALHGSRGSNDRHTKKQRGGSCGVSAALMRNG